MMVAGLELTINRGLPLISRMALHPAFRQVEFRRLADHYGPRADNQYLF
jgi:hypothetical protein